MTGKTFPYPGQQMDVAPFNMKCIRVTVGPDTTYDVAVTSIGEYDLVTIPAGMLVNEVLGFITADWGGTAAITLGDCAAINGYFTDTVLVSTVASTYGKRMSALSMTYSTGVLYSAADIIQLGLSGGANTTGAATFFIFGSLAGQDTN